MTKEDLLVKLLNGEISKKKFSSMRSNARRYNKLELSILLAEVFELYKYEVKNAKEGKE